MGSLIGLNDNINFFLGNTSLKTWLDQGFLNISILHIGGDFDDEYYNINKNLSSVTKVADTLNFLNGESNYVNKTEVKNGVLLSYKILP